MPFDKVWVLLPLIDIEKQTEMGVESLGHILNAGHLNISSVSHEDQLFWEGKAHFPSTLFCI